MTKIFMSYSRGSLGTVKTLARNLESAGHDVWFDQELTGGERWWAAILERIRECDVFVSVLTPDSLESEACKRELAYASDLNRAILPLRLSEEVNIGLLLPPLSEYQISDYIESDARAPFTLMGAIGRCAAQIGSLPDPLPELPGVPESYKGTLLARIEDPQPLDAAGQKEIVFELEQLARQGKPEEDIRELVLRFKKRDDLLMLVAERLDGLLAGAVVKPGRKSSRSEPKRRKTSPDTRQIDPPVKSPAPATRGIRTALSDTVSRLLSGNGSWRIEVDKNNCIVLSAKKKSGRHTVTANATVRDDVSDSKVKALKARGWKISSYSTVKGLVAGGAMYATSGVAALALLSKKVRDEFMTNEASRDWKIADSVDLEKLIDELQLVVAMVAPDAKTVATSRVASTQDLSEVPA